MNNYKILKYPESSLYTITVKNKIENVRFNFTIYANNYWEALRKAQYELNNMREYLIVKIEEKIL